MYKYFAQVHAYGVHTIQLNSILRTEVHYIT